MYPFNLRCSCHCEAGPVKRTLGFRTPLAVASPPFLILRERNKQHHFAFKTTALRMPPVVLFPP
jgi:hypothetical protein